MKSTIRPTLATLMLVGFAVLIADNGSAENASSAGVFEAIDRLVASEDLVVGAPATKIHTVFTQNGFDADIIGRYTFGKPNTGVGVLSTLSCDSACTTPGAIVKTIIIRGTNVKNSSTPPNMKSIFEDRLGIAPSCKGPFGRPAFWPFSMFLNKCEWASAPYAPRLGEVGLQGNETKLVLTFIHR